MHVVVGGGGDLSAVICGVVIERPPCLFDTISWSCLRQTQWLVTHCWVCGNLIGEMTLASSGV